MPPPSSDGVVLLQMLNILEGYALTAMGHNSTDYLYAGVWLWLHHRGRGRGHSAGQRTGDFNAVPGLTDRSGMIGTPLNRVVPQKRPLSSIVGQGCFSDQRIRERAMRVLLVIEVAD